MLHPLVRTASTFVIFSSMLAGSSAFAAEGKALLEKFLAKPEMANAKLEYGSITEQSADSFTLTDVKIIGRDGKQRTVKTIAVEGFKETDDNRVALNSLVMSGLGGETRKDGTVQMESFSASDAEFPADLWAGSLNPESKKQRVTFGSLSISGLDVKEPGNVLTLENVAMKDADIPLDWRYGKNNSSEGEPAAPMTFETFSLSQMKGTGQGGDYSIQSMALNDASIPTSQSADFNQWVRIFSTAAINSVNFTKDGADIFKMENLAVKIDEPDADGTVKSTSSIKDLVVNLKTLPDPRARATMQQLGYEELRASLTGDSAYNPKTGRTEVTNTTLKAEDMFDLSFDYILTGYTAEVAQKLMSIGENAPDGSPPNQAFAAMLPVLSEIKLDTLKMQLTDRSLTGKLLDMQAAQMGTTGDQLAQGAPMMIGMGMGGLGMPEFTEMVTQAIGNFLQNKGSLTIEAKPSEPVPILNLVMQGQTNPTTLPKTLNLSVTGQ